MGIWITTFWHLLVHGDAYYALPRWDVRASARIATVVRRACRLIQHSDRAVPPPSQETEG